MAGVENEHFVVIKGWMRKELKLKGSELILYAIIYGFSQNEDCRYTGSLKYLSEWTGLAKKNIIANLKKLEEKGFIAKEEKKINGVKFCEYRHLRNVIDVFTKRNKEYLQNVTSTIYETLPNNITNNISNNKEHIYTSNFGYSILQNCQMENAKMENGYPENVKPIPDINTDINSNINTDGKVAPVQPQTILDMFNEICKSYPRATKLSESRRKAIKARLKMYSIDDFKQLFEMAEGSSFLKGGNNHNWSANFDWLIKDANMAKVLDGNYSDAGEKQQEEPERRKKEPVSEGFKAIYERNMRRKEMEERGEIPEEPFDPTRLPFQ